ncbi:MAG: TetR/AcrR family transcriptional regulator [Acidimicrobiaceae bacterium]|nr:TetR/AcrR family transcriptional regulator [Acidimicrobiaceae bacterium]
MNFPEDQVSDPTAPRRRERVRTATVAEIKRLAWEQVAEGGALAVSLRAIARSMGMASSALYRYFTGYEQLLSELICDGFTSLADALEEAEAGLSEDISTAEQWQTLGHAYRRWALAHATEYALIFGKRQEEDAERTKSEHDRAMAVLFRCMISGLARGDLDPANLLPLPPGLEPQLLEWQANLGLPLRPADLAGCLFAWTQIHGAISLELFHQLPPMLMPADALFDQHLRSVLRVLSYRAVEA